MFKVVKCVCINSLRSLWICIDSQELEIIQLFKHIMHYCAANMFAIPFVTIDLESKGKGLADYM